MTLRKGKDGHVFVTDGGHWIIDAALNRIDDPKAGWKGRSFWTSYNSYTAWHLEGGIGTKDKVVRIQMRPDPLAK